MPAIRDVAAVVREIMALALLLLSLAVLVLFFVGWAAAQQVADYDAALAPHRAESRQFCGAAPACARMWPAVDTNGNGGRIR